MREYLRFHVGGAAGGRLGDGLQRLRRSAHAGVERQPVWTADPEGDPVPRRHEICGIPIGYSGSLGAASAAVMGDFVVVDMFAEACSGAQTPKAAAARAAERAMRYYKS